MTTTVDVSFSTGSGQEENYPDDDRRGRKKVRVRTVAMGAHTEWSGGREGEGGKIKIEAERRCGDVRHSGRGFRARTSKQAG